MSRTTVFLTVLSASIIALALLADATGFGPQTTTLALVLLPVVLLLGIVTAASSGPAATAPASQIPASRSAGNPDPRQTPLNTGAITMNAT